MKITGKTRRKTGLRRRLAACAAAVVLAAGLMPLPALGAPSVDYDDASDASRAGGATTAVNLTGDPADLADNHALHAVSNCRVKVPVALGFAAAADGQVAGPVAEMVNYSKYPVFVSNIAVSAANGAEIAASSEGLVADQVYIPVRPGGGGADSLGNYTATQEVGGETTVVGAEPAAPGDWNMAADAEGTGVALSLDFRGGKVGGFDRLDADSNVKFGQVDWTVRPGTASQSVQLASSRSEGSLRAGDVLEASTPTDDYAWVTTATPSEQERAMTPASAEEGEGWTLPDGSTAVYPLSGASGRSYEVRSSDVGQRVGVRYQVAPGSSKYAFAMTGEDVARTYAVTWKSWDGSEELAATSVLEGEAPAYPGEDPAMGATAQFTYAFQGWATEARQPSGAAASSLPAASADATYYAAFSATVNTYEVTWKSEDGSTALETDAAVAYNAMPEYNGTEPAKESTDQYAYTFDGWSKVQGGEQVALEAVTEAVTYYAHFAAKLRAYAVTFDAQGHGEAPAQQTVAYGGKVSDPGQLSADGYTFGGWYKEAACENAWNFNSDTVSGTTVLYAKWERISYAVTFESNGGTAVASQTVYADEGGAAAKPDDPTKSGCAFLGWCSDEACTTAYDFGSAVTRDVTVYALWGGTQKVANVSKPSWTFSSDADLKKLLDEYYSGSVTKAAITALPGFQVGATRKVELTDGQVVYFRLMDSSGTYNDTSVSKPVLFVVQTVDSLKDSRVMDSKATHSGGWPATSMRQYLNEEDSGVYKSLLPDGFKSLLREVTVGSAQSRNDATQVTSSDRLFLPARSEVFGYDSGESSYNGEVYPQWSWYQDGANSKVKKVDGSAKKWWLRSPSSTADFHFRCVSDAGTDYFGSADPGDVRYYGGVAPCGCI